MGKKTVQLVTEEELVAKMTNIQNEFIEQLDKLKNGLLEGKVMFEMKSQDQNYITTEEGCRITAEFEI